ncbi:MAG: hypothetical protein E7279_10935 [Lachnospiraceae bacterium]|nr:hypothetical protein [Lachnospiraceae bacterium]
MYKKDTNNKGMATLTIILIVVAVVVVAGGIVGSVVGYNAYQEKKQQEEEIEGQKVIDDARSGTFNSYNDRINQIMASLNVEKEGVASIDNNENIDAMTNAVNELNSITSDINNDALITQEQKDALNATVSGNIDAVNNRINVVNEIKNSITIKDEVIELYTCSYDDLVKNYGSEMKEDISGGMEKVFYIPSLGVSAVYNASGGEILPNQYGAKRVEGKLKNMVSNVNNNMTIEEFVNKMRTHYYDVKYELKPANMASPYTFVQDNAEVNVSKRVYVNPEENTENPGQEYNYAWGAMLKIAVDGSNSVGPDSLVWFRGVGGAL